jgi:hypothetical protein
MYLFKTLKGSGYCISTCFAIKKFFILLIECIYGFRVIRRIKSINQFIFVTEMQWLLCEVETEFLNVT